MSSRRRTSYKPPRDRRELFTAIAVGVMIVVVTAALVWFLRPNRDSGGDAPVITPAPTTAPAPAPVTDPAAEPGTPETGTTGPGAGDSGEGSGEAPPETSAPG